MLFPATSLTSSDLPSPPEVWRVGSTEASRAIILTWGHKLGGTTDKYVLLGQQPALQSRSTGWLFFFLQSRLQAGVHQRTWPHREGRFQIKRSSGLLIVYVCPYLTVWVMWEVVMFTSSLLFVTPDRPSIWTVIQSTACYNKINAAHYVLVDDLQQSDANCQSTLGLQKNGVFSL